VLAEFLLAALPFFAATSLLLAVLLAELAVLAFLAFQNAVRRHNDNGRDLAYGTMALVLTAFWAIPAYDWSLSFAPADIVLAGFLLLFYLRPPSRTSETEFVITATLFGALTAIFEFLTGGIPGGLIILLTALAFDSWPDTHVLKRYTALAMTSFCAAIVLCFAIKIAAVAALWGPQVLLNFSDKLLMHLGSTSWDFGPHNVAQFKRYGITVDMIRSSRFLSTAWGLFNMVYSTSNIGWGSLALGTVLTVIVPLALGLKQLLGLKRQQPVERLQSALVLAAASVVLLWCCAFVEHTIGQAFFMFRIMVWPLAVLLAAEVPQIKHWPKTASIAMILHKK